MYISEIPLVSLTWSKSRMLQVIHSFSTRGNGFLVAAAVLLGLSGADRAGSEVVGSGRNRNQLYAVSSGVGPCGS